MGNAFTNSATLNVLLIDGHERDRSFYASRLKVCSRDYAIFEAANGRSGLRLYRSCHIDCVILEIHLPDISGFEVLSSLVPLPDTPEVPVIILTNISHPGLLEAARENGAQIALLKQSTTPDLLDQSILKVMSEGSPDRYPAVPAFLFESSWPLERSA